VPKAKPVSLWPLSFDEALKKLINTPPAAKATKPKKRSKRQHRS
jgi:hypothetical protein